MAGSYYHCINSKGEFIGVKNLDNLGDAHEALEEMYWMLQYMSGGSKEKLFNAYYEGYCKGHVPPENLRLCTLKDFYPEPDEHEKL